MIFLVDVDELIEVRQGYGTDGLHRASKKYKFQVAAPVSLLKWFIAFYTYEISGSKMFFNYLSTSKICLQICGLCGWIWRAERILCQVTSSIDKHQKAYYEFWWKAMVDEKFPISWFR